MGLEILVCALNIEASPPVASGQYSTYWAWLDSVKGLVEDNGRLLDPEGRMTILDIVIASSYFEK